MALSWGQSKTWRDRRTAYTDGTASLVADGTDYKDGAAIQLLVEQTEQPIQTGQPFMEQTGQPLYRRDSYVDV